MLPMETETVRINRLIFNGGLNSMTELQFFAAEIVTIQSRLLSKAKNNLMGIAPESLRKGGKS